MEEESSVKAPVTRLRRRLSVEAEDVSSPQTPSTPKKRSARLAAKPLLDNIDENAPIPSPKPTRGRKSVSRDHTEPEEKVVTPSRRTIRTRSNTSLTSETPLAVDSPRAKRAARRNSNVGSDTEGPLTPVPQTRKTRKILEDVEQLPEVVEKPAYQLTGETVIFAEEPKVEKPPEKNQDADEEKVLQKSPQNAELQNSTSTVENLAPIPTPKPTRGRKSVSRDLTEPEEKVVTPSRRTIRTRSNTSLTSETLPAVNSPRAKRAPKRNSNIGDAEGPLTPVPQTRKTGKNSEDVEQLPEHIPTKKAILFTEKPQTKRKSKEFQKTPPKVVEKKELQNTPPDLPAEVVEKPAYQLTSETVIFAEEPQVEKPQAKRKSKELHKTPEKTQDSPELPKTPQNVPEKKVLQKSPQNAGLQKSPQNAELQKSPQNAELQNSTSTVENSAEVVKEPPTQLIKTAIEEEPAAKINSEELHKTPQKDAEQIVLQNTPHTATEKIELKHPYPIDEYEVEVVSGKPRHLIQSPLKVPEIANLQIPQTMQEKLQLQNSTFNSFAQVATETTVQCPKETSITAPRPDLQIPQKKRKSKELHQIPQKIPVVRELEKASRIKPVNMEIPVNPHMLLGPFFQNPDESRQHNDLYQKPLTKILETKELTVFVHDDLQNMAQNHTQRPHCNVPKKITKWSNSKVTTGNPNSQPTSKEELEKEIITFLTAYHENSIKCKGARKATQKSHKFNNVSFDKSLPISSSEAILPSSRRKIPAENCINLSPEYLLPNSTNEAIPPTSQRKSSTNVAEKSNKLSVEMSLPNSLNGTIPVSSQRQSPRKSAENSVDILPLDYSLPNSSNEALLSNSLCKSSRKAEKSKDNLSNSSNGAFPEHSIDILPLDYSLPYSSNEAVLPNNGCKSSKKAEKFNYNLSLDISLPNPSNGTIPLNSQRQSPRTSVKNSIDLSLDYSFPNSSNEADKSKDNLTLDKSLPNSSKGAISLNSQRQFSGFSGEKSINIPPLDYSRPNLSDEALLPNRRRKSSRLAKTFNNLSLDKSLPISPNEALTYNNRRQSTKKSVQIEPTIDSEDVIGTPKKPPQQEHPVTQPIIIFPKNWETKPIKKQVEIYFPENWEKTINITKQHENTLETYFPETTNSSTGNLKKQMTKLEKNVTNPSDINKKKRKQCRTDEIFNVNDIGEYTVNDFTFATDVKNSITVYINEDQANMDKLIQLSQDTSNKAGSGDQCVPVVNRLDMPTGIINDLTSVNFNPLGKPKEKTDSISSQKSVEPMDIDESMPRDISITDYSKENLSEVEKQVEFEKPNKPKLSISSSDVSERVKINKEKAGNENKSTLILSLLNDESIAETNLEKSSVIPIKETLENLSNFSNVGKNRDSKKTNLSDITENKDTPLKHKNSNILEMKTSTPVISTKHEIMVEKSLRNTSKNTSTKNISVASRESNKSDSYLTDETSDEENMDKLVMDEAEDAGPDYESGDSQDESEKRYERENEISEEGETLNTDSSEEDGSDDEDHENDSFVVSSDQEGDDLLSGTGDDLSMSDKELTMAAKSKKKFNDRKLKEQKKASKEMYAARHNKKAPLNIGSDTDTSKPLRFVSDDSNDATEEVKPRKKKNRMRLDSSHELSAIKSDADMSVSRDADENKQTLDNNCNSRVLNEHEITAVINESINQKTDPLKNTIKAEPMTPHKGLDISTVNISVREDVEEVQVTENASMMHANETSDPLQATLAFNDDGEPSSSGNEEIIQNYDSMLSELNEKKYKNKVKDHDISLNPYKKSKVKVNNPIEDQLNLTKTKEHKRRKTIESQDKNKSSNKMEVDSTDASLSDSFDSTLDKDKKRNKTHSKSLNPSKKSKSREKEPIVDQLNLTNTKDRNRRTTTIQTEADVTDDTSSDSLDLKLLFPDDESDTSEDIKKKTKESNTDNFIPKLTEGKTDHNESKDDAAISVAYQSVTETSSSRKKNKRLSELQNIGQIDGVTATEKNSSSKKKSKKETLFSVTDSATETTENELNVSKKKKNKKSQDSFTITDSSEIEATETELNVSKKKNKKSKESHTLTDSNDDNLDVSIGSTKKNKRKESLTLTETENIENEGNNSVSSSKMKNRKASESLTDTDMIENEINLSVACNRKKHRKASESLPVADATEIDNQSNILLAETPGITKKKNKKLSKSQSVDEPETKELTEKTENAINTSLVSNKKKNRKTSESFTIPDASDNTSEKPSNTYLPLENDKRNKKNENLSESLPTSQLNSENTLEIITNSSKQKKHKHSKSSEANNENDLKEIIDDAPEEASSKKRKRKSSIAAETQDGPQVSSKLENDSLVAAGNRKKKLKVCAEIENELKTESAAPKSVAETSQDSLKKKEKKQTETTDQDRAKNIPDKRRSKKRKDREDDEGLKQTKVLKENFFDNIQISRLPNAFLEQLGNPKPKRPKHKKIVSTSAFIVEETVKIKNKPSHYHEESISLNSKSPEKGRKNKIEKPKVLPFVPTASTSGRGFTTNFQVQVCPQEFKFIAQSSETVNFKNDYIQSQKLKKLGTYKMYKDQRKVKLSKF